MESYPKYKKLQNTQLLLWSHTFSVPSLLPY